MNSQYTQMPPQRSAAPIVPGHMQSHLVGGNGVAYPQHPGQPIPVPAGVSMAVPPGAMVPPHTTYSHQLPHNTAPRQGGASGGSASKEGYSAWMWGLLILFFILIVIVIAWFIWSSGCNRCNTCGKNPCCCGGGGNSKCCRKCKKSTCECDNSDGDSSS